MIYRRLKGHVTKNAHYEENNEKRLLISYQTTVLCVVRNRLVCRGLYSATTRRHIGWFLRDIGANIDYHDVKKAFQLHNAVDITTGEQLETTEEERNFFGL